jgi:hypothetical protein
MNAVPTTASMQIILAIDLGKYNSVNCVYDQATAWASRRIEITGPASSDLITKKPIDHLDEVARVDTGVGVLIAKAKKVKRSHQLPQTGKCLSGRKRQ